MWSWMGSCSHLVCMHACMHVYMPGWAHAAAIWQALTFTLVHTLTPLTIALILTLTLTLALALTLTSHSHPPHPRPHLTLTQTSQIQ